jgi:hypothetical protein
MRLAELTRHVGYSSVPGIDLFHLFLETDAGATFGESEREALKVRWEERLVRRRLAEPLAFAEDRGGKIHAYATVHPFLHRQVIDEVVTGAVGTEVDERLATQQHGAFFYRNAYGLYHRIARYRGWVSFPVLLGNYTALFLGIGRHCRLVTMNVDESVSAVVAFAGVSKAFCREVLKAHGIPVAPGDVATSVEDAVSIAERLGGDVALKTFRGGNSEGVVLGVRGAACRDAAERLFAKEDEILVERMIAGRELRLHFIGGALHEVRGADAPTVVGDGVTPLAELIRKRLPRYAEIALSNPYQRKRIVLQLFRWGVRDIDDLARVVLPEGVEARVAAATGHGMSVLPIETLDAFDRAKLESFLQRYGASSAGVDVLVDASGKLLAVIEINAPSGFAYLEDAPRAADTELLAFVRRDPTFIADDGKVPVWIGAPKERRDAVSAAFAARFPKGREATLSPEAGWIPVLTERADAFLLWVDDEVIERAGLPANLAPSVIVEKNREELGRRAPVLAEVIERTGGRFVTLENV